MRKFNRNVETRVSHYYQLLQSVAATKTANHALWVSYGPCARYYNQQNHNPCWICGMSVDLIVGIRIIVVSAYRWSQRSFNDLWHWRYRRQSNTYRSMVAMTITINTTIAIRHKTQSTYHLSLSRKAIGNAHIWSHAWYLVSPTCSNTSVHFGLCFNERIKKQFNVETSVFL